MSSHFGTPMTGLVAAAGAEVEVWALLGPSANVVISDLVELCEASGVAPETKHLALAMLACSSVSAAVEGGSEALAYSADMRLLAFTSLWVACKLYERDRQLHKASYFTQFFSATVVDMAKCELGLLALLGMGTRLTTVYDVVSLLVAAKAVDLGGDDDPLDGRRKCCGETGDEESPKQEMTKSLLTYADDLCTLVYFLVAGEELPAPVPGTVYGHTVIGAILCVLVTLTRGEREPTASSDILAWVCAYLGNSAAFDEAQALAFATVITEAIYGGDAHRDGGGVRALF